MLQRMVVLLEGSLSRAVTPFVRGPEVVGHELWEPVGLRKEHSTNTMAVH